MDAEESLMIQQQASCDVAKFFLPEYLQDEINSQGGLEMQQNFEEFTPAVMYQDQMMRLFPRQLVVKFKMLPAFEETMMRWQEEYDQKED